MPKSRRCYISLLVLGGLHLVTGHVSSISGCNGESATLHRDISFNSDNIVINLYKNGDNNTMLAMWSKENSDPVKVSYNNGYDKKVSLDNANILIHNISKCDEGKYVIQHAFGKWSMKNEVNLVVLVAPPKQCTPNIKHEGNNLVAFLDNKYCGHYTAHVSWYKLWTSNISHPVGELNNSWETKGRTISKIFVGKEEDTYCACTESSARRCEGTYDRFDLCSCFKIEKDTIDTTLPEQPEMTTKLSESSDLTKTTTDIHAELMKLDGYAKGLLVLSIILVIAVVIVIAALIILYRKVSSSSGNLESSADTKSSNTKTNDSEAQLLVAYSNECEKKDPSMYSTSSLEDSVCSESNGNGLKSSGSYRKKTKSSNKYTGNYSCISKGSSVNN